MIIDITKAEFKDVPITLDGEVLLEIPVSGGFITCPQEVAYLYAVATNEQRIKDGHDNYDYTGLDKTACNKPDVTALAGVYYYISYNKLNELNVPEPAKAGLLNRINSLVDDMIALPLDDAIRLALQLPIDIENA